MWTLRVVLGFLAALCCVVVVEKKVEPLLNTLKSKEYHADGVLGLLGVNKRKDIYGFNFYNWYVVEMELSDFGYFSQLVIRILAKDSNSTEVREITGFRLPAKSLLHDSTHIQIEHTGLRFTMKQQILRNQKGPRHDGLIYGRPAFFTENVSLEEGAYKGDLTVTSFDLQLNKSNFAVEMQLVHVINHAMCKDTNENELTKRVKCFGGYAEGSFSFERGADPYKSGSPRSRSFYNVNYNRTRTWFEGVRSNAWEGGKGPSTQWHWGQLRMQMHSFSKPQYYAKEENIEKQRSMGFHFSVLPYAFDRQQHFVWVNGRVYPAKPVCDFHLGRLDKFVCRNAPQTKPAFEVEFNPIEEVKLHEEYFLTETKVHSHYGYWNGWIEDKEEHTNATFYTVCGLIESSQSFH